MPALLARGWKVIAASRRPPAQATGGLEWRACDLLQPQALPAALEGVRIAYYLVHSMGTGDEDFRALERRAAQSFADAAAKAGVQRVIYLGGPAPRGDPSEHLRSRLEVGEILRAGPVQTIELRASMVVGNGSASWQIVRDLAMRLPVMVAPRWLSSRTRPVALEDVVAALVGAAEVPLEGSQWFDLPGPEIISGQRILERIAALRGRRILMLKVPLLTPKLSALWLRLVTRTDFALARELVLGLEQDLLSKDERFWELIAHPVRQSFDQAARNALLAESKQGGFRGQAGRLEEHLVDLLGARARNG